MKFILQYSRMLACALVVAASGAAHAQLETVGGAIAATASVDAVIGSVRNALSETISQAEAAGTVVSFRVASDARVLLQNLDVMASELSGKVFGDLTQAQQATLTNLLVVSKETNRDLKNNIAQFDSAVRSAGEEISRLPGVSGRPFVSSYSPNYLVLGSARAIEVVVHGSLLNSDRMQLVLGGAECALLSAVEKALRFSCPVHQLVGTQEKWVTGSLKLTDKKKWFKFWKSDETFGYQLAVHAMQPQMGTYTLETVTTETVQERIGRTASNGYQNGHCKGDHSVVWTYTPGKAACTVDVASVRATSHPTSRSTAEGVVNLGPAGFQVRGVVRNSGKCVWPSKDARGSLNVDVSWTDLCPTVREVAQPVVAGTLAWTREEAITLPANTKRFLVKVKLANGSEQVVSEAGSFPWFVVRYDPVARLLVIRPRPLEEALL
ncbi:MAG: hypothetical protein ACXWC6_11000 [Ramlibacter sp.]